MSRRTEADKIRVELGTHVGYLIAKYRMDFEDGQAINDMAYRIVRMLDTEEERQNG